MNSFVLLSLLCGLLAVDDRAGWQSLLAQPVFVAVLVGLVTGEMAATLPVGLSLELVWLSVLPVRGARRPDQVLGAITGAGCSGLLVSLSGEQRVVVASGVGVFLGLLTGELGGHVTGRLSGGLNRILSGVTLRAHTGARAAARRIAWLHGGAIAYIFAVEALVAFVCLALGFRVADWMAERVTGSMARTAGSWMLLLPVLGVAGVMHVFWRREFWRMTVFGAVVAILIFWLG